MNGLNTPAPCCWKRRSRQSVAQSIHAALSSCQRCYSVFPPAPDNDFLLFHVVHILPSEENREHSPRSTSVNLKSIFDGLKNNHHISNEDHQSVINSFITEFNRTAHEERNYVKTIDHVSDESLRKAGLELTFSTLPSRMEVSSSRAGTTSRRICLKHHSSEVYTGCRQLQALIWRHAEVVFKLIMLHLTDFHLLPSERGLLGIVISRIISTIGVSKNSETKASSSAFATHRRTCTGQPGGEDRSRNEDNYNNLYGVSGLRFIVFPMECTEGDKLHVYKDISVCDSVVSDSGGSFTDYARKTDTLYQAHKWVQRKLDPPSGSDPMIVTRPVQMRSLSLSEEIASIFSGLVNEERPQQSQVALRSAHLSRTTAPEGC